MARLGLHVIITEARGRPVDDHGLGSWLAHAAPTRVQGCVTIALVSDRTMRRLNRDYRRRDYATDVLSFPTDPAETARGPGRPGGRTPARLLGDIAIAQGVARRQARAQGHDLPTELKVLALHGLLHLLGYDHERDGGRMRRVEERLRRRAGLPPGLITRPVGARVRQ